MTQHNVTRRGFIQGCCATVTAMAGTRLSFAAFDAPGADDGEILVVAFLRGGIDGLSLVPPIAGDDRGYYEQARPALAIPASRQFAALPLDDRFGLHPAAAPLHALYQDKRLAVIHAAGLTSDTRSHFDAMEFMERGTPDSKTLTSGWLTRHLQTSPGNGDAVMPTLAIGNLRPTSLLGTRDTISMNTPDDFQYVGNWRYADGQRQALRRMYSGDSWLHQAGLETLNAVDLIESKTSGEYAPANGAAYPEGEFGNNLKVIAQMVKLRLGLRVATLDLGGWDTHEYQGEPDGGYFAQHVGMLSAGLAALYQDLGGAGDLDFTRRLTIVVMSEFGRRLKENASGGTDHGHGNVMLVLGGAVNGGRVHGAWPGLHTDQLFDRADLAIRTDYRRVLSEILIRRLGNPNLGAVFPGYTDYTPLGVVQGPDLPPVYARPMERIFLPLAQRGQA